MPVSLTALSDEEVMMKPQNGKLYKIRYELVDSPGEFLEVSTTRPETIMGDVASPFIPDDERWPTLQGRKVRRPLQSAEIPIIADEAEKDFGTGMLKITPPMTLWILRLGSGITETINVLNADGTLNEFAGAEFAGMDRFDARATVEKLREQGDLIDEEDHANNVGFSERADVPIEPRLSEQWFLALIQWRKPSGQYRRGLFVISPSWSKSYLHWLENIQDWCISRQLWWGHRFPVWYRKGTPRNDPQNWHVSVNGPDDPENWEQEKTVFFDTQDLLLVLAHWPRWVGLSDQDSMQTGS